MKNKKSKKLIILCLLLLLLIGLAIFIINKFGQSSVTVNKESNSFLTQILDENQTNEIKQEETYRTSPDIILPGFADLTIKSGTINVHLDNELYNPEDNIFYNCPRCNTLLEDFTCPRCEKQYSKEEAKFNEYYLKFEMYLCKTNELIYSSNLVTPGYYLEDIKLNRELEVGDYDALIVIRPYRHDMISECNTGSFNITLHVIDTM